MKKLITLIAGFSLIAGIVSCQKSISDVPDRFLNYKEISKKINGKFPCEVSRSMGVYSYLCGYDIDGDRVIDVDLLFTYVPKKMAERNPENFIKDKIGYRNKHPLIYKFDLNGDYKYQEELGEIFYDPFVDGLNGNEKVLELPR